MIQYIQSQNNNPWASGLGIVGSLLSFIPGMQGLGLGMQAAGNVVGKASQQKAPVISQPTATAATAQNALLSSELPSARLRRY